jgi:hypothetical protein
MGVAAPPVMESESYFAAVVPITMPHIAAYYASPRGRTLRSEYWSAIVAGFYRNCRMQNLKERRAKLAA